MSFVAVTTVRDEGAAQIAKEALNDHGIDVELRRQAINPYFASMTSTVYEVRVPEDKVKAAEVVLARIEADFEQALIAQSGAAAEEEAAEPETPPRKFGVAQAGYWLFGLVFAGVLFIALYAWFEGR